MNSFTIPHDYDLATGNQAQKNLSIVALWYKDLLSRFDHKIYASDEVSRLRLIYSLQEMVNLSDLPMVRKLDHTMFEAIDKYTISKVPFEDIVAAVTDGFDIEVHGIYPSHINYFDESINTRFLEPIAFLQQL